VPYIAVEYVFCCRSEFAVKFWAFQRAFAWCDWHFIIIVFCFLSLPSEQKTFGIHCIFCRFVLFIRMVNLCDGLVICYVCFSYGERLSKQRWLHQGHKMFYGSHSTWSIWVQVWSCVFTRESSYCFQRVFAIAILSVRPSVCHSGGSVKNGASYDHQIFTIGCLEDSSFRNRKAFP